MAISRPPRQWRFGCGDVTSTASRIRTLAQVRAGDAFTDSTVPADSCDVSSSARCSRSFEPPGT